MTDSITCTLQWGRGGIEAERSPVPTQAKGIKSRCPLAIDINMVESTKRVNTVALSAGVLIVALAVSFLAAYLLNNLWYFIPFMMLIYGGWTVVVGAMNINKDISKYARADMVYNLFLGVILMAFGVAWMLYLFYPDQFVPILLVFVIIIGVAIVIANVVRAKKKA